MATWADVRKGDIVQSPRDHMAYEVVGVTADRAVTLEREGGQWILRQPTGSVVILLSRAAAMAQAVALAQVHLGGRVHAATDDGEVYRVPVAFAHPGELTTHIFIMHGITSECEGMLDLVRQHSELHRPEIKVNGWVEHIHDPRFAEYLRERTKD